MDLSEEDLDRGMEIITRTKKYMNKEERNILIGILVGVICLIGIACAGIYISYKKSLDVERPGEDYEKIYEDENDVIEVIEPVMKL